MKNKLPTIDIKGKKYVMVKDRLIAFQELYPSGSILTEIISNTDRSVVVKATVKVFDGDGSERIFNGHSEAYREGNMGSVPVEVAETSAVGRALAMLGIGIIESVASADEIVKATGTPRLASEKQKEYLQKRLHDKGLNLLTDKELETLTMEEASKLIDKHGFKPGRSSAVYQNRDNKNEDSNLEAGGEDKTIRNY